MKVSIGRHAANNRQVVYTGSLLLEYGRGGNKFLKGGSRLCERLSL